MKQPLTTTTAYIENRRTPHCVGIHHSTALDQRSALAKELLKGSFVVPKVNGEAKTTELIDVETLVTRAFDAADLFYQQANMRGCLVPVPDRALIDAANEAVSSCSHEPKAA